MAPLSVLYVDDEEDLLIIGKLFLEKSGELKVETALSGEEALKKLESCLYEAVISDYQMPKMNGIELLIELKKRYKDIPFILFTGRGREEVVIQAINNGADFYLQKGGEPKSQFVELEHKIIQAAHHRQAEKALIESELISRTLLDATLDAVLLIDQNLRIISVNETFARRFNRKTDEFTGLSLDQVFDPDMMEKRISRISEVIKTRNAVRFEDERDGLFLENSIYPILDNEGSIQKCVIYSRDITERKQNEVDLLAAYEKIAQDEKTLRDNYEDLLKKEMQIRESETRFRSLTENSPDAIMLFSRDLRYLYANPVAEVLLGHSLTDFIEKKFSELGFPPDLVLFWERILRGVFSTGKTDRAEFVLPSGTWIDWLVIPVFGEDGTVEKVITSSRDITGKKQNEEELKAAYEELLSSQQELKSNYEKLSMSERALRDSERRLSDIINFAPDATVAINTERKVIAWNRAMAEMTGFPAEEMLGRDNYEYSIPIYGERRKMLIDLALADDPELKKMYNKFRRDGDILTAETRNALIRGREVIIWGKASPLYNERNEIVGAIESIRDITGYRRTQEDLKEREALFRGLFDQAFQMAVILDLNGTITRVNEALLSFTNQNADEIIGIPLWEAPLWYEYPGTQNTVQDAVFRAIRGETLIFKVAARGSSGNHSIDLLIKPITDENGQVIALLFEGREIIPDQIRT